MVLNYTVLAWLVTNGNICLAKGSFSRSICSLALLFITYDPRFLSFVEQLTRRSVGECKPLWPNGNDEFRLCTE